MEQGAAELEGGHWAEAEGERGGNSVGINSVCLLVGVAKQGAAWDALA